MDLVLHPAGLAAEKVGEPLDVGVDHHQRETARGVDDPGGVGVGAQPFPRALGEARLLHVEAQSAERFLGCRVDRPVGVGLGDRPALHSVHGGDRVNRQIGTADVVVAAHLDRAGPLLAVRSVLAEFDRGADIGVAVGEHREDPQIAPRGIGVGGARGQGGGQADPGGQPVLVLRHSQGDGPLRRRERRGVQVVTGAVGQPERDRGHPQTDRAVESLVRIELHASLP